MDRRGGFAAREWQAIGTTVRVVVTEPEALEAASRAVRSVVEQIDLACSRFRPDSELSHLNRSHGQPLHVSPLLADAIGAALRAARVTGGAVDPTGGAAIRALGYDRDFESLKNRPPHTREGDSASARPGGAMAFAGWQLVRLDPSAGTVCVPGGVQLDLGATAKGLAADLAAASAASAIGGAGVLVSLGGDVAVAGASPAEGWTVLVADDHRVPLDAPGQRVALHSGGLATSSTTVRRWSGPAGDAHHLLDPTTGEPARGPWRTVSVAAASCLDANVAATASIVKGERAPAWLELQHLPARLVRHDGTVEVVGGWPAIAGDGDAVEQAPPTSSLVAGGRPSAKGR